MLSNLVNNALKFTEAGSVNLTVDRDPANAKNLRFSVRDTGIGIAKDKLDTVFDAFSQADQTTTRKFGGTGPRPRDLPPPCGGDERSHRHRKRAGVGTVFHVIVPIIHVDRLEADRQTRRIGSGKVLLAVSGQATQANLARYLEEFGFEVVDAITDALGREGASAA